MLKKIIQIIIFILLVSLLAIIQFSGIQVLPSIFKDLNLFLIILTFLLFFYGFSSALGMAIIGGFWFDIFSFNFFGFYLLLLFLTVLFTEWVLKTLLTNRSLYSFLLLIFLTTLFYNLGSLVFLYFSASSYKSFLISQSNFLSVLLKQIFWSELLALLLFGTANSLRNNWKPFFLKNK